MQQRNGIIGLSASDVAHFLACRHRTGLDLAVALGLRLTPLWSDPAMEVLQERGLEHERHYVESLRAEGLRILEVPEFGGDQSVESALQAMRQGLDVIVQAPLRFGRWFGRPDVLRRVEKPSAFGDWSYQVYDTKLAEETRGGTILQLSVFSELLTTVQGVSPELFHVVTPDPGKTGFRVVDFRVDDYAAFLRSLRGKLEATAEQDPRSITDAHYPEPVEHCDVCRWWFECDIRRRHDDHLSLVAGISRLQTRELEAAGVDTLKALGELTLPLPFVPRRGAPETYIRVREQARVQLEGRTRRVPVHEILPVSEEHGFRRLPVPSPRDIFLDLEGDPYARSGGREYLFGLVIRGADGAQIYRGRWAITDTEERAGFEELVDFILEQWAADPSMHVYHYAPYEPAALKRLMGRHSTREADIDQMLRTERFVDLYSVVKHSLRASVEKYSIKDLERFYGFTRGVSLDQARIGLRVVERALELNAPDAITPDVRAAVEGYNRDDCISALLLRDWLESLRSELERAGNVVPRPPDNPVPDKVELNDRGVRIQELFRALTDGIPAELAERNEEQQARWLLAHMLDWHWRESKVGWWEFYRLRDLTDEDLLDERDALSGLEHIARVGGTTACPIDRYAFPQQDCEIGPDDELHLRDESTLGTVEAIDLVGRTVDVKKRGKHAGTHPTSVFAHSEVKSGVLADSLIRIADDVIRNGITSDAARSAGRELLLGRPPRLRSGPFVLKPEETELEFAVRIADDLDKTVLAIQGPPGAGKTYTAAKMICELVRLGRRVGVTAISHKVIKNLLEAAQKAAGEAGITMRVAHKVSTLSTNLTSIREFTKPDEMVRELTRGRWDVIGGTAWLWARPDVQAELDVLFVDEAGQMSLANVLAVSPSAPSVVLLGDPRQLEQPQRGSHPEGTDVSALDHILGERKTIPPERGIFLPETWRLAPRICEFTSELFYERRLHPRVGLEQQRLIGTSPFEGAGLWHVPVQHDGNQRSSREEGEAVRRLVSVFLSPKARWVDRHGEEKALTAADILVVAPYNAHVVMLSGMLALQGVRVGTVDRFQGQEAPIVIYSMATSNPEDAPRGMEFLYSLNRLNVATSRAKCACILVASPRLFEPDCKSPRQMQLANAFCRYLELAQTVESF